jgi:LuxR family maltose regulon positive regulatory protein
VNDFAGLPTTQTDVPTPPAPLPPRKFQPIVHIDDALWRERLIARIWEAPPSTARLTVVNAPAGFGKTTLLAQLARQLSGRGVHIAWLNCEARDRDPDIFCENLLAALAASQLTSQNSGKLVSDVAAWIASINEPLAIFFDEYEIASNAVVDQLIVAIALAAPANVSLVLASRELPHLPLTRMQLAGKLRLVDADFLRFSFDETRALLQDFLPGKAVHQVAAYADGWPFALQLVRLRAAGGLLDEWVVDARAKMPRRQIFDYLAEEVFSTLERDIIGFLSEVAVLETVDVGAANAVRQRADSLGFIQRLCALRPIVVVDESSWNARLHPLLRDYLGETLELSAPGRRAELQLRAAQHLAGSGRIYEAVEHAVAGGALERAAQMIEEAGGMLLLVNEGALRVRVLLQQLPAATILRHPRLRLLQLGLQVALGLASSGEFGRIERLIADDDGRPDAPGLLDLEMSRCMMLLQASEVSVKFFPWAIIATAKQMARQHFDEDARSLCVCLAIEITMLHRYGPLERCERRTLEIGRLYANADFGNTQPFVWMYQARNAYTRGELNRAEHIIGHLLLQDANFVNFRPQFLGQITTILRGRILYQRGALEQARDEFAAITPSESFNMFETHVGLRVDPAICAAALGQPAAALELLQAARHYADDEGLPHLRIVASAAQIEIEILFGSPAQALALAEGMALEALWDLASEPFALPWVEVEALARARYFLRDHLGDSAGALGTADTLLRQAIGAGSKLAEITALLMRCRVRHLAGDDKSARDDVQLALEMGMFCGVVQLFLGFGAGLMMLVRQASEDDAGPVGAWASHIVAAWETRFRLRAHASAGFTPRELDVLCELAKDQSTKEIARNLNLSPETVKHYLKAIFGKLDVKTRDDAVAEARRRALMA